MPLFIPSRKIIPLFGTPGREEPNIASRWPSNQVLWRLYPSPNSKVWLARLKTALSANLTSITITSEIFPNISLPIAEALPRNNYQKASSFFVDLARLWSLLILCTSGTLALSGGTDAAPKERWLFVRFRNVYPKSRQRRTPTQAKPTNEKVRSK